MQQPRRVCYVPFHVSRCWGGSRCTCLSLKKEIFLKLCRHYHSSYVRKGQAKVVMGFASEILVALKSARALTAPLIEFLWLVSLLS